MQVFCARELQVWRHVTIEPKLKHPPGHLTEIQDQCKFEHPGRSTNATSRNPFAPLQNNPGAQGGPNPLRGTSTGQFSLNSGTKDNPLFFDFIRQLSAKSQCCSLILSNGVLRNLHCFFHFTFNRHEPVTKTLSSRKFNDTRSTVRYPSLPSCATWLTSVSSYKLDKATIANDLSKERPQWILSAYGPGRDAPLQLFGGHPREQSFEELRLRHYELAAQGNQQQAVQEAHALVNNAEQQIQTALNDVDGAVKYMINGENEHPNRLDVCKAKGATPTQPQISAPNQQTTSTFGQPSSSASALGQPAAPSAFGRPSVTPFGQPPAPASTFGQPSAPTSTFGHPSAPTFGQPSQPSGFSQASKLGRPTTSFGQPSSTFGSPSVPATTFGQPSAPGPFGAPQLQPNTFVNPSGPDFPPQPSAAAKNPFGQPLAPTQPSTFGQPSAPSQPSAFGRPSIRNPSPAFSQPATSGANNGFSQSSTAPPNPLGQPTAPSTTGIFKQPSIAAPNPFGQRRSSTANQPVPSSSQPFGPSNTVQPYTGPAANPANVRSTSGQGTNGVQVQKDSQGKITSWKGTPVRYFDDEPCYKGNDGSWQRIWFPDGPPVFTKTVDLPEEAYDEATKANYRHLKQTGTFKDGIMPTLPPKREWCSWNF